jgi:hypothetical protein
MTTSSYASTAVPTQQQSELTLDANFGSDDFGSMFDNVKRNSIVPPLAANASFARKVSGGGSTRSVSTALTFLRTQDPQPSYPPKTLSRRSTAQNQTQQKRDESESLYARAAAAGYGAQTDSAVSSPGLSEKQSEDDLGKSFFKGSKVGYSLVPDRHNTPSPGPEASFTRNLPTDENAFPHRQTQIDDGDRWVKRVELSDNPTPEYDSPQSTRSKGVPQTTPARTRGLTSPSSQRDSENDITPRAQVAAAAADLVDEPLFDASPNGPASRAIRPSIQSVSESGGARRMTNQQFKLLQKRAEDIDHATGDAEDGSEGEQLDDDEDDTDRAKKSAAQRRKQEANMSVYRQQMRKVTGGGPRDLAPMASPAGGRPDAANRGSSLPNLSNLHFGGVAGAPPPNMNMARNKADDDEDEDVPLGILQAHGFPNGARGPSRLGGGQNDVEYQRRTSVAGSVVNGGGGGGYPAFARRLPQDPYFGAGIVNQSNRESFGMHQSSAASVYGGMSGGPPPTPGGLIGVIANEERARAARRGNPNPQHLGYHAGGSATALPLPANMLSPQQPEMPRAMSMTNNINPMGMMGGMNSGMMPGMMGVPPAMAAQMDPNNPQVQQFMQMQMQFMQNMMAMQQQQVAIQQPMMPNMMPQQQYPQSLLTVPGQQRPTSTFFDGSSGGASRPASMLSTGRAMTMNGPPAGWNAAPAVRPGSAYMMSGGSGASIMNGGGPGPGYTPSIAPSERSNIGLPGRYRPVSSMNLQNPGAVNSSRASVMGVPAGRSQSFTASSMLNFPMQQQQAQMLQQQQQQQQQFQQQQQLQQQQQQFQQPLIQQQAPPQIEKPTIRAIDKPKGFRASFMPSSRASVAPPAKNNDDDDDGEDGWAEMQKKRAEKKKNRWTGLGLLGGGGGSSKSSASGKENDGDSKKGGGSQKGDALKEEDEGGLGELGEMYKGLNV